ncbi:MAG: type I-D CRISPR-associated protein Cas5/Csc1 [Methanosarcinales archaeon]
MKVFYCVLEPHDFLFFSSYDQSKLGITETRIHDIALTYAMNYKGRALDTEKIPKYEEDLANMNIYVTPARLISKIDPETVEMTYNAVDDASISTESIKEWTKRDQTFNIPSSGSYIKLAPNSFPISSRYAKNKFEFYAFTMDNNKPRSVIRIGKKGCIARIISKELSYEVRTATKDNPIVPTHLINPLAIDTSKVELQKFHAIRIPPCSLIDHAQISGEFMYAKEKDISHYIVNHNLSKLGANTIVPSGITDTKQSMLGMWC